MMDLEDIDLKTAIEIVDRFQLEKPAVTWAEKQLECALALVLDCAKQIASEIEISHRNNSIENADPGIAEDYGATPRNEGE